jgi:hypothetical protein
MSFNYRTDGDKPLVFENPSLAGTHDEGIVADDGLRSTTESMENADSCQSPIPCLRSHSYHALGSSKL